MSEATYFFNTNGSCLWVDSAYLIDGSLTSFGYATYGNAHCILDGNNCYGSNLGTITKVEIRAFGYGDGGDKIGLEPEFTGGVGTEVEHIMPVEASKDWSSYQDITTDTNAPSPWTWNAVQTLEALIYHRPTAKANNLYCAKVEIRVTYTPSGGGVARSYGYLF